MSQVSDSRSRSAEEVEQVKRLHRGIIHLMRLQVARVAAGPTPAGSVEVRQRADREMLVETVFQSLTTTLAAVAEGRVPWVQMHRPVSPGRAEMVLHIQSRDRPRRTRGAAAEACAPSAVYTLRVVALQGGRAEAVQGPALETASLRRITVAEVAQEVTSVAREEQALAETDTKVSSSFVYRLPKFLSVK
jgi:hypothetical protein